MKNWEVEVKKHWNQALDSCLYCLNRAEIVSENLLQTV